MISIIIPVYNGEDYIERLNASFEKQSYTDFELIFINDGSTDRSLLKIKELVAKGTHPVTYIDQDHAGVSAARNAGIRAASGEFISFCDVDDTVQPNYLKKMVTVLMDQEVDLVFGRLLVIKNGKEVDLDYTKNVSIVHRDQFLRDYLFGRLALSCCAMMVRKNKLTEHALYFADGYKYGEDLHMMWQLITYSNTIAFIDQPLYVYHLEPQSAMNTFTKDRFHCYDLMIDLETFFEEKRPSFAKIFKKYAANKVIWSIAWQWSTHVSNAQFSAFVSEYQIKEKMRGLLTFSNRKVAASALLCLVSPTLFRMVAIWFGKRYIH